MTTSSHTTAVRRSLRRKLLLPLALLTLGIGLVAIAFVWFSARRQLIHELEQRGALIAHTVNNYAESISRPGELQRFVTALGAEDEILDVAVIGINPLRVFAATRPDWLGRPFSELPGEKLDSALAKAVNAGVSSGLYDSARHHFDYIAPLRINRPGVGDTRGAIILHIDATDVESVVTRLTILHAAVVLSVLAFLGGTTYWLFLTHYVLRPLAALDRAAVFHRNNPSEAWRTAETDDEIGNLARRLRESFAQTDSALAELENQKFALDQHAVVAVIDAAGRFTHVNDKFCLLSGYARHELLGQPHRLLHSGIHPPEFYADLQSSLAYGRTWHRELCNRAKDGSLYWTDATLVPLTSPAGQSHPYISIQTDITARRQAEEEIHNLNANLEKLVAERTAELARSEAQLRLIWETSHDGLRLSDADGIILSVNAAYCRIANLPREKLLGLHVTQTYAEEEKAKILEIHQRSFQDGGSNEPIIKQLKRHDGVLLDLEVVHAVIAPSDGSPVLFSAISDVTERKAAEARLRQSDQRFRAIFERSPIMIALLTAPEGRLVEFNEAGLAAFGYTRDEARGRTVDELGIWSDTDQRDRLVSELMATGHVTGRETRLRRRNGEIFTVLYNASIVELGGQIYSLNSLVDISAQRASEQRLALTLDATADGLWDWNIATGEVYFSPQWQRLLGYEPGDITGRVESFFPLIHPDDIANVRTAIEDHCAGLTPLKQGEVRLLHQSGEYRWFLDRGKVVERDDSGQPMRMVGTITDISDRKRSERSLLLTQFSIDRSADAVFWIKPDSTILYVNDAASRMFGYTRDELVGHNITQLNPGSNPSSWAEHWAELKSKKSLTFEVDHTTKSGDIIHTEVTANHLQFEGEEYNCATMRDITQRKRFERSLLLTQFSIDRSADAIFWIKPDATIFYVNESATRMLGYTRDELVGRTIPDIDPNFPRERWPDHWAELKTAKSLTFETNHIPKSGGIIDAEITANYIQFEGEEYNCATMRDITRRKRSERSLEMMQFSVDHAADAVFWLGPDASIRYVNEAAVDRLGYTRGNFLKLSLLDIDLDMSPVLWSEHWETLKREGTVNFERRHRTHDGHFISVEVTANYVDFGGEEFNFAFARDITERKRLAAEQSRLQERVYQNQKFEALGTLAGGIAHDFNNILTAIINYTGLARDDCPPTHPHIRQFLEEVLKGSERAKQLVRQILLFSRSQIAEREPLKLHRAVKDALSFLRSAIPSSVEILADLQPDAPTVLANATQIHQVVMNLAINASQAMQPGGGLLTVRLSARFLAETDIAVLPELKPGPHLSLEITDTGVGMKPAVLARIFEPFFTTKPVGEGTGIGLAVVRNIVRGHDGAITVHSQPGRGSSFTILLPAVAETPVPVTATPALPRGRGQHILLVDDETMIVKSVHILLERLGYRVTSCINPYDALARFQAAPETFDAVITDYQMPGKTGLELTHQIRKLHPRIPVLVFSGFAGKLSPEQVRVAGIADLVSKPVNKEEIAHLLSQHLA